MKLDNSKIFTECALVTDGDFDNAVEIGMKILAYARANDCAALSANQMGYDFMMCVVRDNDGHDIYINPEIEVGKLDGEFNMDMPKRPMDYKLESFPGKRVLIDVAPEVHVNAYSVGKDERVDFTADGILAEIWQVMGYVMNGVNEDDIYNSDFKTIKGTDKKKRNAKCDCCGLKNKKCTCQEN